VYHRYYKYWLHGDFSLIFNLCSVSNISCRNLVILTGLGLKMVFVQMSLSRKCLILFKNVSNEIDLEITLPFLYEYIGI